MAKEPQDAVLNILKQIQAKLLEHDQRFEQIDRRFEQIDRRFERMQEQIDHRFDLVDRRFDELTDASIKALGAASYANVRHDREQQHDAGVELELRDIRARLSKLEEKV